MTYPAPLQAIIDLCAGLPEPERRETLWSYAKTAEAQAPRPGETYVVIDERKDPECLDEVGIYLAIDGNQHATFRVRLGPKVQTLTRAMATIICTGFNGQPLSNILESEREFVDEIVGEELMRLRSRTVYYMWERMREAARQALETQ